MGLKLTALPVEFGRTAGAVPEAEAFATLPSKP
jgi:hypothetical protein